MAKAREVEQHVSDFLERRASLENLEDWSASYLPVVYRSGDSDAIAAIQNVRAVLNAFENEDSEDGLRMELAAAIRSFESRAMLPNAAAKFYDANGWEDLIRAHLDSNDNVPTQLGTATAYGSDPSNLRQMAVVLA